MLAVYRGCGWFVSCNPEACHVCNNLTELIKRNLSTACKHYKTLNDETAMITLFIKTL
jgi:hypothetical protein